MTKPNALMIVSDDFARLATPGGIFDTLRLHEGFYVKIDDGRQYPQLCAGGGFMGPTLTYESPEQLARDCDATLYKTEAGFQRAAARIMGAE